MRKVIAEIAISLDGYIEGKNGELDWLVFDEEKTYVTDFLSRFDVIFYGRTAYEKFGLYVAAEDRETATADYSGTLSTMRKYVFTRSLKHVPGNGMVINNHIAENVRRIKDEDGKDIWLCGGARIISTFAALDLIDEYLLAVQPVILGAGTPLFKNIPGRIRLNLVNAERLESGVVILNYQPASI